MEADLYISLKNTNLFILFEDYYFADSSKDLVCISCLFWTSSDFNKEYYHQEFFTEKWEWAKTQDRYQVWIHAVKLYNHSSFRNTFYTQYLFRKQTKIPLMIYCINLKIRAKMPQYVLA